MVARAFKMRGLAVQASALDATMNILKHETSQSARETLDNLLDEVKDRMMSSSGVGDSQMSSSQLVVTKRLLSEVVADMSRDGGDVTDEAVQLLDAFQMHRLAYNPMRKQFTLMTDRMEARSLFADPVHKVRARSEWGAWV